MKNKIVEILEGSIDPWGERNANDIAEEILNLINLEKAKENCYQEEKMRDKGWLHKDDPVKGLRVERECPDKNCGWFSGGHIFHSCYPCFKDGKVSSPLTVGEALEQLMSIVTLREISYACKDTLAPFLFTKDGGRIVMEEK